MRTDINKITETILAIERWSKEDFHGYLDTYSDDVTYFYAITEKLLVVYKAVSEHILKLYQNPNILRSEYLNPEVTVSDAGDLAVLSYNMRNFVADEKLLTVWNCTKVYRLINGKWRIMFYFSR